MTREYVREIIDTLSEEQFNKFIIILQKEDFIQKNTEKAKKPKALKAKGIFRECANPEMIPFEKGAWERAVVEKYAKNKNS